MSGKEESKTPQPGALRGLNLEQACELGRGNATFQDQQNFQTLSMEVATITARLEEVLPI